MSQQSILSFLEGEHRFAIKHFNLQDRHAYQSDFITNTIIYNCNFNSFIQIKEISRDSLAIKGK